jgi:hypothetical protein
MVAPCLHAESNPGGWLKTLKPTSPGSRPLPVPFHAEYRFGWSGIEAARAKAKFSVKDGIATVHVTGKTTGAARALWPLDAENTSRFRSPSLEPLGFTQTEKYRNRTIDTIAEFRKEGLWRYRARRPGTGGERWKRIRIEPVRDMVTTMFFIRSQTLADGEIIRLIAFPGDSPFLVETEVLRRETLRHPITKKDVPTIRVLLRLSRIQLEKNKPPRLREHGKFRTGTVWISDDVGRIPLRAEVDVFIGSIFAELTELRMPVGSR